MALLSAPLPPEAARRVEALKRPGEAVATSGRQLYLLLEHGVRGCKLFAGMERVDPRATTRSWNTLAKLDALTGD